MLLKKYFYIFRIHIEHVVLTIYNVKNLWHYSKQEICDHKSKLIDTVYFTRFFFNNNPISKTNVIFHNLLFFFSYYFRISDWLKFHLILPIITNCHLTCLDKWNIYFYKFGFLFYFRLRLVNELNHIHKESLF